MNEIVPQSDFEQQDKRGSLGVRQTIEAAFLKLIRFYTFNTPIKKGRHRIVGLAQGLCHDLPRRGRIKSKEGWPLDITYSRNANGAVYFLGEYEPELSAIVKGLLRSGDTCVDVGANFGWYTMLFSHLCGRNGAVHSFEPVPGALEQLKANVDLLGPRSNVRVNDLALGDREGEIQINTFEALGLGFSSIADLGRTDAKPVACRMTTLDNYLAEKDPGEVDFIKVDIEGAEMLLFRGAKTLFEQERPPMMMIEIVAELTARFGYSPNDLLSLIGGIANYNFFAADEMTGKMKKFDEFGPDDTGANVFCLPAGHFEDRVESIRERLI